MHALGRHNPLTGSAANRAIVVVAGASVDQGKVVARARRGMVVLAMFTVFVAMHMLADFAGRTVMHMVAMHVVVCVAVQQVARGPGRQINGRQQAGCQAISK